MIIIIIIKSLLFLIAPSFYLGTEMGEWQKIFVQDIFLS